MEFVGSLAAILLVLMVLLKIVQGVVGSIDEVVHARREGVSLATAKQHIRRNRRVGTACRLH